MTSRVAVVGLGILTGFGIGREHLWNGIANAASAIRPIAGLPNGEIHRNGSQLLDYDPDHHFLNRSGAVLDVVSQIGVVSAREAVAQAGLTREALSAMGRRATVIYGASPGQVTLDDGYHALYDRKVARLHPFTVPRILPAGGAAAIAIEMGVHGPCFATGSACATSTHAIGLGFDSIRLGRTDVAIVGGADASIVFGYVRAWVALRLLATDIARPFSRDRTGITLGEGAGTIVLEAWDHAVARGATILAEIVGFGMSSDAVDMVAPDAASAADAMRAAIEDADIATQQIGFVSAHGTGTRVNDRTEAEALHQVFGSRVPPTSSLKSQVGHTLNGAGGVETAAVVMALDHQVMPATISHREADTECDIDCVPNTPRPAEFEYVMKNSLGFGGLNAVLILRKAA